MVALFYCSIENVSYFYVLNQTCFEQQAKKQLQ
jgi:hypothetical protein